MIRQTSRGFTLIEVLIAMTLLSVMVVLLFSSLRTAAESWNAGESKIAEVNTKAVVYQFFKRHLTTIRPMPMLSNEQKTFPKAQQDDLQNQQAFQGFRQSLNFVAALPAASARKGLQVFNIASDSANRSTLLVTLTPYRQTDIDVNAEPDRPEVLLEDIADFKFSYFGKTEDMADQKWHDEWKMADRLPRLIKVTIQLADGSDWPEMVFPLKINHSTNPEVKQNGGGE